MQILQTRYNPFIEIATSGQSFFRRNVMIEEWWPVSGVSIQNGSFVLRIITTLPRPNLEYSRMLHIPPV
jgi:hypothetical protein